MLERQSQRTREYSDTVRGELIRAVEGKVSDQWIEVTSMIIGQEVERLVGRGTANNRIKTLIKPVISRRIIVLSKNPGDIGTSIRTAIDTALCKLVDPQIEPHTTHTHSSHRNPTLLRNRRRQRFAIRNRQRV